MSDERKRYANAADMIDDTIGGDFAKEFRKNMELKAAVRRRRLHLTERETGFKNSPYREDGTWTNDSERQHDIDASRIADAYLAILDENEALRIALSLPVHDGPATLLPPLPDADVATLAEEIRDDVHQAFADAKEDARRFDESEKAIVSRMTQDRQDNLGTQCKPSRWERFRCWLFGPRRKRIDNPITRCSHELARLARRMEEAEKERKGDN